MLTELQTRWCKNEFTANLYMMHVITGLSGVSEKRIADAKRHLRAENAEQLGTDHISRRAALAQRIAEVQQDGKVALIVDSMDCDCYRSVTGSLYPAAAAILARVIDRIYEDAEGPTSVYIDSPDQMPEPYGRDLALEAFEDGHPHVVYM